MPSGTSGAWAEGRQMAGRFITKRLRRSTIATPSGRVEGVMPMRSRALTTATVVGLLITACGGAEENTNSAAEVTDVPATSPSVPSVDTEPSEVSVPPSSVVYPRETNVLEVEDGTPGSIDEMHEQSDLVVVGSVRSISSLGRPGLDDGDSFADEYVAIDITVDSVLKGDETDTVVLGWAAFQVDASGERVATWIANGVPPPREGDRLLLFLINADPAFVEWLNRVPTHQPTQLDGIAFLDDAGAIVMTEGGSPLGAARTLKAVREEIS
ncbi:MAG: hypothetical protein WKF45_01700 [Ilumatobacteraceae bacterium]